MTETDSHYFDLGQEGGELFDQILKIRAKALRQGEPSSADLEPSSTDLINGMVTVETVDDNGEPARAYIPGDTVYEDDIQEIVSAPPEDTVASFVLRIVPDADTSKGKIYNVPQAGKVEQIL